jgi:hypothetical protein
MSVKFSDNLNDRASMAFESMGNGSAAAAKSTVPLKSRRNHHADRAPGRKPIVHHPGKIAAQSLPNDCAPRTAKAARPQP